MTDDQALQQAINDSPDDDGPRLAYADWLEERGDPRGEFIRVQCELARIDEDDERRDDLERREKALLAEHGEKWAAPVKSAVTSYRFRRGFVEEVTVGAKKFLEQAAKLFAKAPVRRLRINRLGSSTVKPEDLAACPQLARVRELQLQGELDAAQLRVVFRSPHLKGLKSLMLDGGRFPGEAIQEIVDAGLSELEELNFPNAPLLGNLKPLAAKKLPFRLRKLSLQFASLRGDDAAVLADAPGLAGLTHLDLHENEIRVRGAEALAASRHLKNLTYLDLQGCATGVTGTTALAGSKVLGKVTHLGLRRCNVGDTGLRALLASPHLGNVTTLLLGLNNLTAESARALAAWPGLAHVRKLHLNDNEGLGDDGAAALAASPHVAGLRDLNLERTNLGSEGVRALAASPHLKGLRCLKLQFCDVREEGAKAVVESPHLSQLRYLNLDGGGVNGATRKQLVARFGEEVCQMG